MVVVLDGHGAGVEEDEDDDEPEPPLLLAHPPHPELELLQRQHQPWEGNIQQMYLLIASF